MKLTLSTLRTHIAELKLEHSTLRTHIAALSFLLLGSLLLVLASHVKTPWLSVLLLNVGSFIIASVVMTLIFRFWQLRGLLDDLFRHVGVAEQIQRARLSGCSVSFYEIVPGEELFTESNRLDLMVSYAATWRNTHESQLERFLARADAQLNVVLPDPDVKTTLNELGTRFGLESGEVERRIRESATFFQHLGVGARGTVRIYYFARAPHFTFYRFNNRVVFASYRHRQARGPVLTLIGGRGGEFYDWIRDEWYGITREGLASGITREFHVSRQAGPQL